MTTQTVPDKQALNRFDILSIIFTGLAIGLAAPTSISFRATGVTIVLDCVADLLRWRAQFGMEHREASGQPYPSLTDPADMDRWSVRSWMKVHGWHLSLNATDPITDEQRDGWMTSGKAAEHAAYEAREAAKNADPTGLTYTRADTEPDNPTPVSPARGGQPHVVAVTDGGLVDETPDGDCLPPGCPPGWCAGADDCQREYDGDGNEVYPDDLLHAPLCACGCRDSSVVLVDEPPAASLMPAPIAAHYDASADLDEHLCACGKEYGGMDSLQRHIGAGNAKPVCELVDETPAVFDPARHCIEQPDHEPHDGHVYRCCGKVGRISRHNPGCPKLTAAAPVSESR